MLPSTINLENVQKMLNSSGQKLSANAEKCKMFMQIYGKAQAEKNIMSQKAMATPSNEQLSELHLESTLKTYIDERFQQMEMKIMERLNLMEEQQNQKLSQILKYLENK